MGKWYPIRGLKYSDLAEQQQNIFWFHGPLVFILMELAVKEYFKVTDNH